MCPLFFSPIKKSITEFSAPKRVRVFKFCIHLEMGQIYGVKENQDAVPNFAFFFLFALFAISQSSIIYREMCVNDFIGTAAPRILKFGENHRYDSSDCVKENQHAAVYHSLCLSMFLSLQAIFCYKFHSLYES